MKATPFANTPDFEAALGRFYAVWSSTELNIDCAIGKLKGIPPEQAHALVAGLKFSDKVKLLCSLLDKSNYANIGQLQQFLKDIENEFRNVFSHSFIASDANSVSFIHRQSKRGKYSCTCYSFTVSNFPIYVQNFVALSRGFEKALGFSRKEIGDFAAYALPETK